MNKKMFVSFMLVFAIVISMIPFSGAAYIEPSKVEIIDLGDGFTAVITTTVISNSQTRSVNETVYAQKNANVKYSGKLLGTFSLFGDFSYNGTSAKATSDNWIANPSSGYDYDGNSSHSGATVKGSCTFTGNGYSKTVTLKITCDKNGNIS